MVLVLIDSMFTDWSCDDFFLPYLAKIDVLENSNLWLLGKGYVDLLIFYRMATYNGLLF